VINGDYPKCIIKMFKLILSRPSYFAKNPAFYDIFRIQINIFFKSELGGKCQKANLRKMFGAFNEKYYDVEKNGLYLCMY
jgi:hypothetical protein